MTLRQKFEAWAQKPPREWNTSRYEPRRKLEAWPGQYYEYHVQCAWEAVQAVSDGEIEIEEDRS